MSKYDELKRLAEACLHGDPWYTAEDLSGRQTFGQFLAQDRGYIAAAKPAAILELIAENEALRTDAARWAFVRSPIGTSSTLAVWHEGKMPVFSGVADRMVDEAMAREASK